MISPLLFLSYKVEIWLFDRSRFCRHYKPNPFIEAKRKTNSIRYLYELIIQSLLWERSKVERLKRDEKFGNSDMML